MKRKLAVIIIASIVVFQTAIGHCIFGGGPTISWPTGEPGGRFTATEQQVAPPSYNDLLRAAQTPAPVEPATGKPQGRFSQ